jgi:hypothetical protein
LKYAVNSHKFVVALGKEIDACADGHFNFLHLWPGQNPPLDAVMMV